MGPYLAEGTHVHRNVSPASVPCAQRVIMGRVAVCASKWQFGTFGLYLGRAASVLGSWPAERAKGLLI